MSDWVPYIVAAPLLTGFVLSLLVALVNFASEIRRSGHPLDSAL